MEEKELAISFRNWKDLLQVMYICHPKTGKASLKTRPRV
jgi:hypothetical protein